MHILIKFVYDYLFHNERPLELLKTDHCSAVEYSSMKSCCGGRCLEDALGLRWMGADL